MNRPWPAAVLAALTLISSTTAQPALLPGEALTYRVSWGIFFAAGEIKIFAEPAPAAIPSDRILNVTTTVTRGFARALYAFDARAEALVEAPTGRLISHVETTTTKEKKRGTSPRSTTPNVLRSTATRSNPDETSMCRSRPEIRSTSS